MLYSLSDLPRFHQNGLAEQYVVHCLSMVAKKQNLVAKHWQASAWRMRVYARDSGWYVRVNADEAHSTENTHNWSHKNEIIYSLVGCSLVFLRKLRAHQIVKEFSIFFFLTERFSTLYKRTCYCSLSLVSEFRPHPPNHFYTIFPSTHKDFRSSLLPSSWRQNPTWI